MMEITEMLRKTSSVATLKTAVQRFLAKKKLNYDVSYYTKDEWEDRGESVGNGASLTIVGEGALYMTFNLLGNWIECTKTIDEFGIVLERHGYWYELGHHWSIHLYTLESL